MRLRSMRMAFPVRRRGEWPVLLRVMGKDGQDGRYLGLQDVIDLFKNRNFPQRMNERMLPRRR